MKIFIWAICILVNSVITASLGMKGITLGGIPTLLLYVATFGVARTLCKKWDDKKEQKQVTDNYRKASDDTDAPRAKRTVNNPTHFCRKCGSKLPENATTCTECGTEDVKVKCFLKCDKCERTIPDDSKFCRFCRNEIQNRVTASETKPDEAVETSVPAVILSDTAEKSEICLDGVMTDEDMAKALLEAYAAEAKKAIKANDENRSNYEGDSDFGIVLGKPVFIPMSKFIESQSEYLDRLRTAKGEKITWRRIGGTTSGEGISGITDMYETYLPSGEYYKTIYINMYGTKKSEAPPAGFVFKESGVPIESKPQECTGDGKKYPNTARNVILCVLVAIALLVCGFGGYIGYNYYQFTDALERDAFFEAQYYSSKIPFSESILSAEHEYMNAGLLMEKGEYIKAYHAFKQISDYTVPEFILSDLERMIYRQGQKEYRKGNYSTAEKYFNEIPKYSQSDDYLLLIECRGNSEEALRKASIYYPDLLRLLEDDFEDADDVILENDEAFQKYLIGTWRESSREDAYLFEIYENEAGTGLSAWHNLPHTESGSYFLIEDGVYYEGEAESEMVEILRFKIIDEDTVSVYCYKDNKSYKLYRK